MVPEAKFKIAVYAVTLFVDVTLFMVMLDELATYNVPFPDIFRVSITIFEELDTLIDLYSISCIVTLEIEI